MNNSFKIADIISKKIKGDIHPIEQAELQNWIDKSAKNKALYEKSLQTQHQLHKLEAYHTVDKEKAWNKISAQTFSGKRRTLQQKMMRYAAAIFIPLCVAGGISYLLLNAKNNSLASLDETIKPRTQKATLVLSHGGTVELDPESTQHDFTEEGVTINNKSNQLEYSLRDHVAARKRVVYNELKTPFGGGYHLKLADGTKVWINAGSSLKFPVEFVDSIREVQLIGEAYFDVSHNGKPFIVKTGETKVRVLGTEFNVSAYSDEAYVTTTLVEGKVQLHILGKPVDGNKKTILTPGLQAVFDKSDKNMVVNKVETSQYTSWMDGKLEFTNQELDQVMKKLARHYDFEYTFKNDEAKQYHFSARIDGNEPVSNVLNMLQMTTHVTFNIHNNTIEIE